MVPLSKSPSFEVMVWVPPAFVHVTVVFTRAATVRGENVRVAPPAVIASVNPSAHAEIATAPPQAKAARPKSRFFIRRGL